MKKILWFILLIILNPKFILANEVIYSDYTDYTEFDENYVDSSELIDVKKEGRYLWYKEEFVEGDYELYNGGNNYILDDCYDSEYSSWMTNKEEKKGRIYEERVVYDYELSKPLRYIHLTNLYGSYGAFRIPELIIKINGVSIDYDYICEGCLEDFDKYIKNGIYNENKSYIKNGGSLIIDLKKEYPIQNVELIFYIFDLGEDDKKYTISYSLDKENIYASKDYVYEFSDEYWINSKLINHYIYDLGLKDLWTINIVRYTPLENEYVLNEKTYKEYRYKERYCKTYTINKKYSETYTKEPYQDFNIKDEEKSKVFYASRTREKLELKDSLLLNSYQYDLNDFVVYSSNNYEITSDININKNGIYNISFKTNRINVDRKVSVNILDNDIKMYQDEIDELNKNIIELNEKVLNLEIEYKNQLSDKDAIIESLTNDLKLCKENCEEQINCINKEINEKNKLIEEYKNENENLIQQIKSLNEEVKVLEEANTTYLDKIQELEKTNNQYKNKVNQLLNDLHRLNTNLDTLARDNVSKKQEIEKLNKLINEYEQDISNLNSEIDNYNKLINELKENSELELGNISNILMDANTKNEIYLEKINLLENNIMNLNSIINSLKLENQDNIIKYENEVLSLKMLNEEYLKKIKELEIQLHNLNSSISYTINSKDEVISSCEEELKTIKKDAFDEYGKLNAKINEETKEKEYLNNKLNNYMLKIDGENKINLVYIVILVLSLLYLFLRKKSSEK